MHVFRRGRVSSRDDDIISQPGEAVTAQHPECVQRHWSVHCTMICFMLHEFHLNKNDVFEKPTAADSARGVLLGGGPAASSSGARLGDHSEGHTPAPSPGGGLQRPWGWWAACCCLGSLGVNVML